jgi:transcription antitermination factor NusG
VTRITLLQPSAEPIEHVRWHWFPLAVVPGKERLARLLLEASGLVTFCPVEVQLRNVNWHDRARRTKRRIVRPWIPGVIFVGLRPPYPWIAVMAPPVVHHVIGPEPGRPRAMKTADIGRLIRLRDSERFVRPDEQQGGGGVDFRPGDSVRVLRGPVEGDVYRVEQIRDGVARLFGLWFGVDRGFEAPIEVLEKA